MIPRLWPCPGSDGSASEEYALAFDAGRPLRLLIVPALFDEANRLRRLTVEVMRRLDRAGIDSFLPDLPGCNESTAPLDAQSVESWQDAMAAAAAHFEASHCLGIRGGCLFMPTARPGWHYAPVKGANLLRQMMRARILASREAGREESQDTLLELGRAEGLVLSGHALGAEFISHFESLKPPVRANLQTIDQDMVGGSGLWLRAEPGESREQADALAAILAIGMRA